MKPTVCQKKFIMLQLAAGVSMTMKLNDVPAHHVWCEDDAGISISFQEANNSFQNNQRYILIEAYFAHDHIAIKVRHDDEETLINADVLDLIRHSEAGNKFVDFYASVVETFMLSSFKDQMTNKVKFIDKSKDVVKPPTLTAKGFFKRITGTTVVNEVYQCQLNLEDASTHYAILAKDVAEKIKVGDYLASDGSGSFNIINSSHVQ